MLVEVVGGRREGGSDFECWDGCEVGGCGGMQGSKEEVE